MLGAILNKAFIPQLIWNSVSIVVDGTCKSIQYSRCILLNVVKKLVDTANRLNS